MITTTSLSISDLDKLARSYITEDLAVRAGIARVDSVTGAGIVGRSPAGRDYAGLLFPYYWPGEKEPREYRLRRDLPDLELQPGGEVKEKGKYLSPPGRGNMLYLPPDTFPEDLLDVSVPAVFTEGEKKALALWRMSSELSVRIFVIALPGVWNWRGKVGRVPGEDGRQRDVKGPIPDLDRIDWAGRLVWVCYDANVRADENVAAARSGLAREIARREARVHFVELPEVPGVNGVDDLLALKGAAEVWELFRQAWPAAEWRKHIERPQPLMRPEEKRARRRALNDWARRYEAAEAEAAGIGATAEGEALPRQISRHADAVSFVLVAAECPAKFRAYVDALVGAADGNGEDWFDAPDFRVGMRARAEADLSRDPEELRTVFVEPVKRSAVEKWTQRARKDFNGWQEATGLTFVETMPGGKIDGANQASRYRLPLLRLVAEAYEEALLDPRWKAKPARALRKAASAVVKRERAALVNPPRRERCRRPRETPAKHRRLSLTYARKLYDDFAVGGLIARADEELRELAEAILNKRFSDDAPQPVEGNRWRTIASAKRRPRAATPA